ncbi:hypothetical protein [Arthrobacter sp. ISL-28]|uniref:hypothetical protein n=1 Tax=Arthrobacter sp. ISL-28 TaxID=2819108 RepID=UPI001BE5A9E6|nr:hypothetical protein [Arthrobacter sp. ISL-28]MBT2519896.1 hypothetical protein [Arthrobacter sp. ISL-28]
MQNNVVMTPCRLRPLSPHQVVQLQDALLASADLPLVFALTILDGGHVALAHSPAILGMEESGRALDSMTPNRYWENWTQENPLAIA